MTIMNEIEVKSDNEDHQSEHSESDNSAGEGDEDDLANTGWADAISKILKQKSKKKSIVLSKAKKIADVKKVKKTSLSFEIEDTDDVVKEENDDVKPESGEPVRKKRKEITKVRIKPNILEKDRERLLQKIATKGVVQLFNAVKSQQKDISKQLEEAGPLEVRKEKVLKNIDKRAFLDVLMGEKSQRLETDSVNENKVKHTEKNDTWSVLKNDFMMGAKMKDWDKELENNNSESD